MNNVIDHLLDSMSRGHTMAPSEITSYILKHDDLPEEKKGQLQSVRSFVKGTLKNRLREALKQRTGESLVASKTGRKCAFPEAFVNNVIDHVLDSRSRGHTMTIQQITTYILNHDDLPKEKQGCWALVRNFVRGTLRNKVSEALKQRIIVEERPHLKTKLFVNFLDLDPSIMEDAWAILDPLFLSPSRHPAEEGDGMVLTAYAPFNKYYTLCVKAQKYPRQYFGENCTNNTSVRTVTRYSYASGTGVNTAGISER